MGLIIGLVIRHVIMEFIEVVDERHNVKLIKELVQLYSMN